MTALARPKSFAQDDRLRRLGGSKTIAPAPGEEKAAIPFLVNHAPREGRGPPNIGAAASSKAEKRIGRSERPMADRTIVGRRRALKDISLGRGYEETRDE